MPARSNGTILLVVGVLVLLGTGIPLTVAKVAEFRARAAVRACRAERETIAQTMSALATRELNFPSRRKTADNPEWVRLASELRANRQRIWQLDVDAPAAERRAAAAGARASGLVPYAALSALLTLGGYLMRRQEQSRPRSGCTVARRRVDPDAQSARAGSFRSSVGSAPDRPSRVGPSVRRHR